jgi:hypothetical protein
VICSAALTPVKEKGRYRLLQRPTSKLNKERAATRFSLRHRPSSGETENTRLGSGLALDSQTGLCQSFSVSHTVKTTNEILIQFWIGILRGENERMDFTPDESKRQLNSLPEMLFLNSD